NYSLALDVKLMVQTVKVLFMKASTQGVDGRLDDGAGAAGPGEGGCHLQRKQTFD
ncbi:MAG: hypothetical protein HFG60_14720, partial [Lachnospiraceae bacterium]|nr:hypothetical protein [Lachnospiraceae bacterium]